MFRERLLLVLIPSFCVSVAASGNEPPVAIIRTNPPADSGGVISGEGPLTVTFNTCRSSDPDEGDEVKSYFDFDGDREWDEIGFCRQSHTYGLTSGAGHCTGARVCVWDRQPFEGHFSCRSFEVCITGTAKPEATPIFLATGWDGANSYLYAMDASGNLSTIGLLGSGGGTQPCGDLAWDPSGQLWYNASFGASAVGHLLKVNPSSGAVTLGVGTYPGTCGLAISSVGIAYASPSINGGIAMIDLTTGVQTRLQPNPSTRFFSGLAFDQTGALYGVDWFANDLVVIDPSNGAVTSVGSLGPAHTALGSSMAITFDSRDRLWLIQISTTPPCCEGSLYLVDPATAGKMLVRSGLPMLTGFAPRH